AAYEPLTRIKPAVLDDPAKGVEGGKALTTADLETIDPDNPIRTLVIGIVADPDKDEDVKSNAEVKKEVERMRENLNRMARAGQGKDINDTSVEAFFADDVSSLKAAISDALTFIETHVEQPGKGKMLETPAANDILNQDASQYDFYYSSFRIRGDNVWEGYLTRYMVNETEEKGFEVEKAWELNDKLLSERNGSGTSGWRKLMRWNGSSFTDIPPNDAEFASFTGLIPGNMSAANLPGDTFGSHSAANAFYDWLNGYDHSYSQGKDYKRTNILADLGQQGVAMVSDPPIGIGPPGYTEWTQERNLEINRQAPVIYLQSNDGILHTVDPVRGDEKMALIPPPMLLPARMATMKTQAYGGGKLSWMDVNGDESQLKSGDVTLRRAYPVYLLDGALISRRLSNSDGSRWHTYLLGALGRGGKGLYALDVDTYSQPRFLWYKEKIGEKLARMKNEESSPSLSEPAQDDSDRFWMKLGLNSPKPAIGVTGNPGSMLNFIALTGGFDETVDLSRNGRDGAVLMFVDPEDGSVIKGFGSGEVDNDMRIGSGETGNSPYMGMMVSEPTLLSSAQGSEYASYMTGTVYAADNRGSIFSVDMEREESDLAVTPISPNGWKLETVATLQSREELSSSASTNSYAIPHGVTAVRKNGWVWLAGGTANIIVTRDDTKYPDGRLENASQMIFSFKTDKSQTDVYTRNDLKVLKAIGEDIYTIEDPEHGWMINLEKGDKSAGKSSEYVSAKPIVTGGVIYIPTFVEQKIDVTDPNTLCNLSPRGSGEARLYAVYVDSGARYWGEAVGRFTAIPGIKITGFSISYSGGKRRITASYDNLTGEEPVIDERTGATDVGELSAFMIDAPFESTVNMEPGQDMIYYWMKE
ncbi:MAG: hypothetical protein LBB28_00380, partial [Synergistaceae bacterium]|nr:hypothetical protein [Synergistaceae bacterium]